MADKGRLLTDSTNHAATVIEFTSGKSMHNRSILISARNSAHNFSVKFSESVCVASVASLTKKMAARSIAYHAHGTADSDKFCCYPWLVCHHIKSAMLCSLRLAPTMINHLTSILLNLLLSSPLSIPITKLVKARISPAQHVFTHRGTIHIW